MVVGAHVGEAAGGVQRVEGLHGAVGGEQGQRAAQVALAPVVRQLAQPPLGELPGGLVLAGLLGLGLGHRDLVLLHPGRLVDCEPPLLLVALAQLGGLHRGLQLGLGHAFEEPGAGLFPEFPALGADLAQPGRLLGGGVRVVGRGAGGEGGAVDPALGAHRLVAVRAQEAAGPSTTTHTAATTIVTCGHWRTLCKLT